MVGPADCEVLAFAEAAHPEDPSGVGAKAQGASVAAPAPDLEEVACAVECVGACVEAYEVALTVAARAAASAAVACAAAGCEDSETAAGAVAAAVQTKRLP